MFCLYNVNYYKLLSAYVISHDEPDVHLIVAGGYDDALPENVHHFAELQQLAGELRVTERITFLRSPSDSRKQLLLHHCCGVLYTPQNEHFGIVPLEAMYMRRPVIATNTGGPLETVSRLVLVGYLQRIVVPVPKILDAIFILTPVFVLIMLNSVCFQIEDGGTGYLCEPTPQAFGEAMLKLCRERDLVAELGEEGRRRVIALFSFNTFQRGLQEMALRLVPSQEDSRRRR